ncbi:MAG TPA: hypothetical protein VK116_10570 [Planctomycetota bacterium]|nr:hypothetical protein [Planctomycetota bacterium]
MVTSSKSAAACVANRLGAQATGSAHGRAVIAIIINVQRGRGDGAREAQGSCRRR